jgi:malate dehydrogenase (oxaloacetate-decarboxylating)(NADP+)
LSCVQLLVRLGLKPEHITLTDSKGVVHAGRENLSDLMAPYARATDARILPDVLPGADIFLGLSAPRVFNPDWLPLLAERPIILALANPEPEILPELIIAGRPDAIFATGRSDYPNQVNNVLCFPYIFRGALDVGATQINEEMKLAAVNAIAELARVEPEETVASAYGGASLIFGRDHIIPKPFDPRLVQLVPVAVARAAIESGVATRPIDFDEYRTRLRALTHRSDRLMNPVFEAARQTRARIAYGQGADARVLRAAQTAVDERLATPILIGAWNTITDKIAELGLRLQPGRDVEIIDPRSDDSLIDRLLPAYHAIVERRGISREEAARLLRDEPTVTASMLLQAGEVDGALCGGIGDWGAQVKYVMPIIPRRANVSRGYALSGMIIGNRTLFFCDTHLNVDPSAAEIAEMTSLAVEAVRGFGVTPKVALLSHSNFGAADTPSARKMREALALIQDAKPDFVVDGEMHADAALMEPLRERLTSTSPITGAANLLIMPNLDAANISITLLAGAANALGVGPLLIGMSKPVHILVEAATARSIVNMTAFAAAAVSRN